MNYEDGKCKDREHVIPVSEVVFVFVQQKEEQFEYLVYLTSKRHANTPTETQIHLTTYDIVQISMAVLCKNPN